MRPAFLPKAPRNGVSTPSCRDLLSAFSCSVSLSSTTPQRTRKTKLLLLALLGCAPCALGLS